MKRSKASPDSPLRFFFDKHRLSMRLPQELSVTESPRKPEFNKGIPLIHLECLIEFFNPIPEFAVKDLNSSASEIGQQI